MKKMNFFVLVVLLNTLALNVFSQKRVKKAPLEITGAALLNDVRTKDYAVSVYLDGIKIDSVFNKSKRSINFYVNYNEVYTLLFQKDGCKDKIIIVNTNIPVGLEFMMDETFAFELEMSQSLTKNIKDMEDYPVAILRISKEEEILETSRAYNAFTHRD